MHTIFPPSSLNRRAFLKRFGAASLGALTIERLLADPYAFSAPSVQARSSQIRIRGSVKSAGKGLARVAISDGISVVSTKSDGSFELVTSGNQQFVFLSVPCGYEIPMNPTGTARFYQPISTSKDTLYVHWNLWKDQ